MVIPNTERIIPLIKRNRKQILETQESAKTVALDTSETNALHTTNIALTVKNGTTLLVCVRLRRKVQSISYKKVRIVQIQESVLKAEDVSSVESCGNRWLAMLIFYCEQNKLKTKLKCQLDTGATCNVLSYIDLSIIKQDSNPHMDTVLRTLKTTVLVGWPEQKSQVIKLELTGRNLSAYWHLVQTPTYHHSQDN